MRDEATLFRALEDAAAAVARLDQALHHHPLQPALLYRARLEAARQQALVDGHAIDPWQLAAALEGLRLRMDPGLCIVERGQVFEAARTALKLHQWLIAPDPAQADEIAAAERHLAKTHICPLLDAADGLRTWLAQGGARGPMRAALVRFWQTRGVAHLPLPLTGARALAGDEPQSEDWRVAFLHALADEAADCLDLLARLERGWWAARCQVTGRRRHSRAPAAVDVLAATPLLSATRLAAILGMAIKSATELLDQFAASGIVVEVTHRAARRLFGLAGMAPVREQAAPPYRRLAKVSYAAPTVEPLPPRQQWPAIDYAMLETALAECDRAIRNTRQQAPSRPRVDSTDAQLIHRAGAQKVDSTDAL